MHELVCSRPPSNIHLCIVKVAPRIYLCIVKVKAGRLVRCNIINQGGGGKQVVYNEFIADRHHIHMNSTKWYTLTDFVKFLGREGLCKVDETPKGWFISLIHRDPVEEIEEQKRLARRKAEKVRFP